MIVRAACYERVSTDEQAKFGFSIATQIDALNEYCDKNNMKVVAHYTDEGVSGGKPAFKRPQMAKLLEDVRDKKVDIILFTRLDRWFRNVQEYFKVQEILDKYGVQWKAIWEDYDTSTSNGRLAITIFLAIAQNEREKGSERIKAVFANKVKNKECLFNPQSMPFGYKNVKDENGIPRMVKDPDLQEAVQDFWDIAVKYESFSKAMRYCNEKYGLHRQDQSWLIMSRNEIYTGTYRGIEGYCEPYVSVEDFNRLRGRKVKTAQKNRIYLFSGLMTCPHCGKKLKSGYSTVKKADGTKKDFFHYRCREHRMHLCEFGYSIAESKVEKYLLANIYKLLENEIAKVEVENKKPRRKPKNGVPALKERLRRLNVAFVAGGMTDDEYTTEVKELTQRIAQAEIALQQEIGERDTTSLQKLLEMDFRNIYQTLSQEDKRRLWRSIIKQINLDENGIVSVDFLYPQIMS